MNVTSSQGKRMIRGCPLWAIGSGGASIPQVVPIPGFFGEHLRNLTGGITFARGGVGWRKRLGESFCPMRWTARPVSRTLCGAFELSVVDQSSVSLGCGEIFAPSD
jgi:hypothetical protein